MYKITDHQFVICFLPTTIINEVITGAPEINLQKFIIREFENLQVLANTNLELPDVMGQIRSVQGSDLTNDAATTQVTVRLLITPMVTVYLSLWDEAVSTFRGLLKSGDISQSFMVVTTVNPKIFGGNLYLNSTPATQFYFDTDLPEISEFTRSLGGTSSDVFHCVDTMEGLQKKEVVSIANLNTFTFNSNEQTQEADFLCKARIVSVLHQNGWSFVSCTGCNRKLEKSGTSLRFNKYLTPIFTGVIRFRVELAVDDGQDSAMFVVFDKQMTKLIKKEAAALALEEAPNGGEEELPSCLEELAGKAFVFQIHVTPYNFTANHRSFTVSTLTEDPSIDNQPESASSNIEASSSEPVVGGNQTKGGGRTTSPGIDNVEKSRKRPRE
ncbi:hypothetical protein N665_0179s0021 [Sinapis alba]|nr:hypothetical protein N665_0179s0021 [Sinapis alba]